MAHFYRKLIHTYQNYKNKYKTMKNKELEDWFNSLADECFDVRIEPKKKVNITPELTPDEIAEFLNNTKSEILANDELFK